MALGYLNTSNADTERSWPADKEGCNDNMCGPRNNDDLTENCDERGVCTKQHITPKSKPKPKQPDPEAPLTS